MYDEPDVVKMLREAEKLGKLQSSLPSPSEEFEVQETIPEKASDDSVSIFKEDVEKTKEKDFTIIRELKKEKRKSGISVVGDVPWGTHLCQFYKTKEDLLDILVPYFKAGLENNEFCMWVTSEPLNVEEAKTALGKVVKDLDDYIKKRQIEILDYRSWYIKSGEFDSDRVLKGWVEKEKRALKKGFDGLRLTGNTFWLDKETWKDFTEYERVVNSVIDKYRMIAICSYSLDKCDASGILDVISNHQFALIRRNGSWVVIESSERKKAEEALREGEEKWASLTGNTNDVIMMVDSKGIIHYINKTIPPYTPKETIGKTIYEYVPKDHQDIMSNSLRKVFKTGEPDNYEVSSNIPKIGTMWFSTKVVPIKHDKEVKNVIMISADITEHKRMEERLHETEERFRIAAETSNDVVYEWDMQHSIQWFGKIDEMLGYGPGEFPRTFDAWTDLVHPEDKKRVAAVVQAYLDGRMPYAIEYRVLTKDGTCRWWSARGAVTRTSDGHPIRWIGTITDITERKNTEKEVIESEEKLKRILDSSPDAITVTDLNGNIIECNQATSMLHGFKKKELIGKNALELFSPKDLERAKESLKKTLELESVKNLEYTLLTKDGREFPAELSACLIRDTSGNPLSFVAITKDITERKRAEEALKENEEKYRNVVERANDGIVIIQDMIIKYVNPRAFDVLGYDPTEMIGTLMTNYIHPDELPKVVEYYKRHIAGEDAPRIYESAFVHKEGRRIDVELSGGVITYQGKTADMIMIHDVTERKKAEKELKEKIEELERYKKLTVDREMKMIELKKKIIELKEKLMKR
jgi:hypothetical protein